MENEPIAKDHGQGKTKMTVPQNIRDHTHSR
jgi:hypothetical protein